MTPPGGQDSVFFCFFFVFFWSSPCLAQHIDRVRSWQAAQNLHLVLFHTHSDTDAHAHTHTSTQRDTGFSALGRQPTIIQAMEDGGPAEKLEVDEEGQKDGRTTPEGGAATEKTEGEAKALERKNLGRP